MLIAWMIYAVALTAIVAGCAIALDRVAEIWNVSRRAIWLVALIVAIAVPAGLALRPGEPPPIAPASVDQSQKHEAFSAEALPSRKKQREVLTTREFSLTRLPRDAALPAFWNRLAGGAWLLGSLVLAVLLLRGAVSLWRGQTRWSRTIVDGHLVLVTSDLGPAVVGVLRPRILLPSWALALGSEERELMLEHEAQHVRSRDPVLIAVALWAVALFPWNPAVWFIVKRLRLAIEIDCDRRVLARRGADARDYGMLLLAVGARSSSTLRFAVSLAEPRRFLEQRILAMTMSRPSKPLFASAPFAAIAILAAVAVAQTPRPDSSLIKRPAPPRVAPAREAVEPPASPPAYPVLERVEQQRARVPQRATPNVPPRVPEERVPAWPATEPAPAIPISVIRGWIELHHPNVIAGDPRVNAITIVVDENNAFLASVADSLETAAPGDPPPIFMRRSGTLIGPVMRSRSRRPAIVVDGVRVDSAAQLDTIPIESVEVIKGKAAASEYGPDAENGIVVIRSMRPDAGHLRRLGVLPDNIKEMTQLHLRPGAMGPNRLYVAVLQLKKY